MNKSRILLPAMAMLFLTACASTQSNLAPAGATELSLQDRYMRAVSASAAANHAEVHWVNIPEEDDLVRYKED